MKKLLTVAALTAATCVSFGQGVVNFNNSSSTLISAGTVPNASTGTSMPGSSTRLFYFAIFVAPSGTVTGDDQAAPLPNDPLWQTVGGTNVNHATAVGRLATTATAVVIPGVAGGGTADFIVRGWSANAGASWAAALAFWNGGNPAQDMWLGSSEIGNNIILGDGAAIGTPTLFGVSGTQVGGFNMVLYSVPEPSSMVLAGLGAASLLLFRRRK